jgi:hypothetical protein
MGLLAGLIVFGVLRVWLGAEWGAIGNMSGVMNIRVIKNNMLWLPLAMAVGMKGTVLPIGLTLAAFVAARKPRVLLLFAFAALPVLAAAIAVYDLSRSLAYAFPVYFAAMAIIPSVLPLQEMRRLFACAALASAVFPTYVVLLGVFPMLPVWRFVF